MTRGKSLLGGATVLALAGILAAPAWAQPQPRYSTPAEHAQTERLNAEQASVPAIIVVAPDASVEMTGDTDAVVAYNDAVSEANQQAQDRYAAQLRDYETAKQNYQQQLRSYENRKDTYEDRSLTYQDHSAVYDSDLRGEAR